MGKYKLLINSESILRNDGATIPVDIYNSDYREYIDWVNDGNTPDPADPQLDVLEISTDSNIIIGDGSDEIILSVRGPKNALVTINVLTGVTPSTVNIQLDELGNGLQTFSCETSPTVILFSHGETSLKVRAL